MIVFRRTFQGITACSFVMIPSYMGFWLLDIGGPKGMMDADSYPVSMVVMPISAAIFSGAAFWLVIFPWAHVARWTANRDGLGLSKGCAIAVYLPTLLGILFGLVSNDIFSAVAAGFYLGLASLVFWLTTARIEVAKSVAGRAK